MSAIALLNNQDPIPVQSVSNKSLTSPFVLIGDHAGKAIPLRLADLGLSEANLERHIALDIGVEKLGRSLADRLGATFVWQTYSRLVADCNRDPLDPEWAVTYSDNSRIPGNEMLDEGQLAARKIEVFDPYHDAISELLDRRLESNLETILISLHSFTPIMDNTRRPWEIGILHDGHEDCFAHGLLRVASRSGYVIGDNEPYKMDSTDYTVPRHAFVRELRYAEIEVKQDLIQNDVTEIADLLATLFEQALR